jgi:YidC/Oxa1 family membrane protein insertase
LINVSYNIVNDSNKPFVGRLYGQLLRVKPNTKTSLLHAYATYTGAVVSTPSDHYQKEKFKDMASEPVALSATKGWVAMSQHYFISAWIPTNSKSGNYFYSHVYNGGKYGIGAASPTITIKPKQQKTLSGNLYVGPAIAKRLKAAAPYLDLTIDYGWLWFISDIIFWVMSLIHSFVGNWGWSIVLTTLFIKLLFYPLSAKSYGSMG